MASSINLSGLFAELARFGQNGDWDRALKTSNKILKEIPDDVTAFHCKIICLIQLSQFQEALTSVSKHAKLSSNLMFEKAYCLYRLNQIKESLQIIQAIPNPPSKVLELKAQVLYRLERYEDCFDVYRELIKNTEDDYEEERQTNLAAVICNLHAINSKKAKDMPEIQEHTYELCYNAASTLLARGKYKEAIVKLKKAEDLCRKSLEDDDVPEDEIESELGIIRVQLGYALQMQQKHEEALRLYNLVVKQKPSDIGLTAVACNNIISINKDQNVFDSKKKIKQATVEGLEHKLTKQQQQIIALNHCLLLMYTNQNDQCRLLIKKLREKYPNCAEVILISAALFCREKQVSKAVELLQGFISKHPEYSLNISLTQAQLLLTQGHVHQACEILRSLQGISYKPGVVSVLVTLYLSLEDKDSASQVLTDAVDWYQKNQPKSPELTVLWRESANFHLRNGHPEAAAKCLEDLRRVNPKDMKTLAQLITAYSQFDPKKAQLVSKELPPVSELSKSIDVDSLETTSWILGAKYVKKSGKTEPSPAVAKPSGGDELLIKKKKKKKKKGKLPKNYDPSVDPDPERWLPRRERSTYKKRKDKRGGVGKGTQGATASATDIDASKGSAPLSSPRLLGGANPSPSATAVSPGPQGPRQQRPVPTQKKKKKKGGKW